MIIQVKELSKHFGGLKAVKNVSFDVNENEIVGIIGPNGAGKTTLFNLISGSLGVTSGKVIFNNEDITSQKPYVICKKGIGRTYQIVKPFGNISVLENVMVGAFNKASNTREAREYSMEILKKVGLDKKKDQVGKSLTIADKKRLEVAKALATQPTVLLLDEVMAGLNPSEVKEIMPMIKGLRDSGITIILIEHIMEVVMNVCDRIVVVHHGEKIAEGTPKEIANNPEVIKAYLGEELSFA
ncbi:ABC transporter ATP-binding protein [Bacillus sp. ISL-75]|uniref:ABC transporter ATP-binding protein n=1 Tax=unclassified Bacillus (in: firmicutes) TaxID=185979 RepID=UPI000BFB16A1|nr:MULTISPECIES: ABC transporter ATP-binding protein [unclassified Bacillus (in: firmicutes)]MBT2727454.1 ABC transporter ATP-binding protein [Bacillus sp. ISL-75]PGY15297.1 ABC transporter ATP-binding protein [Bacillus sp. AFS031507]